MQRQQPVAVIYCRWRMRYGNIHMVWSRAFYYYIGVVTICVYTYRSSNGYRCIYFISFLQWCRLHRDTYGNIVSGLGLSETHGLSYAIREHIMCRWQFHAECYANRGRAGCSNIYMERAGRCDHNNKHFGVIPGFISGAHTNCISCCRVIQRGHYLYGGWLQCSSYYHSYGKRPSISNAVCLAGCGV